MKNPARLRIDCGGLVPRTGGYRAHHSLGRSGGGNVCRRCCWSPTWPRPWGKFLVKTKVDSKQTLVVMKIKVKEDIQVARGDDQMMIEREVFMLPAKPHICYYQGGWGVFYPAPINGPPRLSYILVSHLFETHASPPNLFSSELLLRQNFTPFNFYEKPPSQLNKHTLSSKAYQICHRNWKPSSLNSWRSWGTSSHGASLTALIQALHARTYSW